MLKSKEIVREGEIFFVETQEFLGSGKSTIAGIPLLTTFLFP